MDPVDKFNAVKEACKPGCANDWNNYLACGERIKAKGHGDCEPWYFDYLKCIDKCAVPQFKNTIVRK